MFQRFFCFIAILSLTSSAHCQAPRPIVYTVRFGELADNKAHVEAEVPTGSRPAIEMMMPIWTPGYYRVENYASKVTNFKARTKEGKDLKFEHPAKNRWKVETGGATSVLLSYQLTCTNRSVTGNFVGKDLMVLNGGPAFMTLVEKAKRPHEVRLELPDAWKSSMSGLDAAEDGKPNHFVAADYDTLVDSPIMAGNLVVSEFHVGKSKHYVVAGGDTAQWDGKRAAADFKKFVEENERLWGPLPFKKYVFLFAVREKGGGGGGLEHANSALMMSSSSATRGDKPNLNWLMFVSHEYYHAFNVKRLRPVELGPFDYEKEPRTTGLWVAEGLTTYYGDLLVARAGFCDTKEYLGRVSSHIDRLQKSPGRLVQTLNQASHDVWNGGMSGVGGSPKTISYYVKGPVVGFLLDAKIQRATKGAKSLDDVMRLAYHRYGGDKGFTADQFRQTAEDVAGIDLKSPFHQWLATTEELDYTEALDWFGLQFQGKTWRLEVRENATEAQRARLEHWLAKTEYRPVSLGKSGLESKVTAIPDDVIKRYKLDTTFYKKHLDYKGFSILSSDKVSDEGLFEARYLIDKLLGEREDVLKAMIKNGARFMIMAPTEMTTHVPEQRHLKNDPKTNWDTRARGLGGKLSSCGEENLLNLKGDRYRQENILIHEFNHAIHSQGLRTVDPTFQGRLKKTYDSAIEKGLWKGTYVATNPGEYWAEGAQAYFDCMRPQFGANTREKLQKYDPGLFALVDEVYKQSKYRYVRYDQRKKVEQEIVAPAGSLMLIGGGHQDLSDKLRDEFFELAGGKKAKIVVIPTPVANADTPSPPDQFTKIWQDLKPLSVTVLHTRDRKMADDPAFVKPLTEATAVFITNGHRDRIFEAYRGTLVEKELKKLLARGGLVGGTGTGACVLGDLTIDRADETRLTEPGLGLLAGFLIEDRSELERLASAVAANPKVIGLSVDPDTAIVIRGKDMQVIGTRMVTLQLANAPDAKASTQLLKSGAKLDLTQLRRDALKGGK